MDAKLPNQILRFGVVGTLGFIVNAGIVEILQGSLPPVRSQVIAFPIAATCTWALNRRYTFQKTTRPAHQEWVHYVSSNIVAWTVNNAICAYALWRVTLAQQHPALAVALGSLAGMLFSFTAAKSLYRPAKPGPRRTPT